jgi:hypothetical protein
MPNKLDIESTIEEQCIEPRCALVIGNSKYDQRPLHNPGNDAIAIASKLEECGFNVQMEIDLDLQAFNTAIRLFGKRLRENGGGVGLVFYSGHGIQVGGTNYLLPTDFNAVEEADAKGQAIQADRLLEHMDNAGCSLNLMILDACRDNPLVSRTRSLTRGLAVMTAKGDTLIIYATEPNGVAQDGKKGQNSVFTEALLSVIDHPNIPVEKAIKIVTKKVQKATNGKQRPWTNQSLTSEFFFNYIEGHSNEYNQSSPFTDNSKNSKKLFSTSVKIASFLLIIFIIIRITGFQFIYNEIILWLSGEEKLTTESLSGVYNFDIASDSHLVFHGDGNVNLVDPSAPDYPYSQGQYTVSVNMVTINIRIWDGELICEYDKGDLHCGGNFGTLSRDNNYLTKNPPFFLTENYPVNTLVEPKYSSTGNYREDFVFHKDWTYTYTSKTSKGSQITKGAYRVEGDTVFLENHNSYTACQFLLSSNETSKDKYALTCKDNSIYFHSEKTPLLWFFNVYKNR